jgi:hypothetical protein
MQKVLKYFYWTRKMWNLCAINIVRAVFIDINQKDEWTINEPNESNSEYNTCLKQKIKLLLKIIQQTTIFSFGGVGGEDDRK